MSKLTVLYCVVFCFLFLFCITYLQQHYDKINENDKNTNSSSKPPNLDLKLTILKAACIVFFFSFLFFAFYSYNDKRTNNVLNNVLNGDSTVMSSQLNTPNSSNQTTICALSNRYPIANHNQEQIIVFNILREMFNTDNHDNSNTNTYHDESDIEISYESIIDSNNNLTVSVDDLPSYENAIKKQTNNR